LTESADKEVEIHEQYVADEKNRELNNKEEDLDKVSVRSRADDLDESNNFKLTNVINDMKMQENIRNNKTTQNS